MDTADYLLQHLNNNKNSLLFMKIEQLKKQNKQLVDEIDTTKKLLDDHKIGKRDNSRKIWTIYSFLVWYNEYFVLR